MCKELTTDITLTYFTTLYYVLLQLTNCIKLLIISKINILQINSRANKSELLEILNTEYTPELLIFIYSMKLINLIVYTK